jgi:pyruvyltransferase
VKPIKLYWWRGEGAENPLQQNFGDYLSPLLVEMVAGKPVIYAPVEQADMFAIGTILKRERKARRLLLPRRLHIWGSGAGEASERFSSRHFYHAVRGTFTQERICPSTSITPVLGDPGLLVRDYWSGRPRPDKRYSLGVIPHFIDQDSEAVRQLLSISGSRLINVFSPIDEILSEVMRCHYVVSSSMHGLIVSDAFGIPNRRIVISGRIKSSEKFADYYSAFGMPEPVWLEPSSIEGSKDPATLIGDYPTRNVDRVCNDLVRAFPDL